MNVKLFQNTLHHLLYFAAFIKLVITFIFLATFENCGDHFSILDQFPINSKAPRATLFIVYSILSSVLTLIIILNLILCALNLVAAIFANQFPELIFAVGMAYLVYIPADSYLAYSFIAMMFAVQNMIEPEMARMFNITNILNRTALETLHLKKLAYRTFEDDTIDGWSPFSAADSYSKMVIDYTQLQCCGLTGRKDWEMRLPESCCSAKFANNCTFSNAHEKSCLTDLNQYTHCTHIYVLIAGTLMLLTILSTVICLYYSYFVTKYQDLTFTYEDASSDEEF